MGSQLDLDQGGTSRQWVRTYMGPSVGWVYLPGLNPLPTITIPGTYTILPDTTLVQVNCNGAVVIILPSAINPLVPAGVLPALFAKKPITIVDIGGFALTHPITIQPASIAENIVGFASIQITSNYGAYTLNPSDRQRGWTVISTGTGVFAPNTIYGNFAGTPLLPYQVSSVNQVSGAGQNLLNNSGLGLTTNISTVLVGNAIPIASFATSSLHSNVVTFVSTGVGGLKPGKLVALFGAASSTLTFSGANVTLGTTISNAPAGTFSALAAGDLVWNKGGTNHSARTQFRVVAIGGGGSELQVNGALVNEAGVGFILDTIQGGYAIDPSVNGMPQAGNPFAAAFYYYPLQITSTGVNTFNATMAGHDLDAGATSAARAYEVTNGTQGTGLTIGPDWWSVTNTLSWYKMRGYDWDGTTIVNKPGSLYSIKMVKGATGAEQFFYDLTAQDPATSNVTTNYAGLANFLGKTITCGAYIWCPNASKGRLYINDGGASTLSAFVTPGSYQWVEVTKTISVNATIVQFGFTTDTGSIGDVFFLTQPICLFGNLPIGEGNYRPAPAAFKMFYGHINYFWYIGRQVPTSAFIHVEQESCGLLPTGMQAIQADVEAHNDTELSYLFLADNPNPPQMSALTLYNQTIGTTTTVNTMVVGVGRQPTGDANFYTDYQYLFVNSTHFTVTTDLLGGIYS